MPRKRNAIPSLLRHKAKQLGYVKIHGNFTYLGHWPDGKGQPPDDVWENYQRFVSEYRARGGFALPVKPPAHGAKAASATPATITVAELVARWLAWAEGYYVHPDGTQTGELHACRSALRPLVHLYGRTAALAVGPLKLKAVRQIMIDGYHHPEYGEQQPLSRALINARVRRCVRVWRWGVAEELVPVEVYQALRAVPGLPKGRSSVRETEPVKPVAVEAVEATLPYLQPGPRAMVQLQLLTGMRPGEVCRLRLADLDRSGDVWLYHPGRHKTRHRGKRRVVAIGPKAQAVLTEYLDAREVPGDRPLFSPARDREERFAAKRAARKTPVQPSQADRKKARPMKVPGEVWVTTAYTAAVARACRRAGVEHWHPNQLRHTHGTAVRKRYGLEGAQVALGHSQANITEVYAERDEALARRVALEMG